jgi:hypothetical protein
VINVILFQQIARPSTAIAQIDAESDLLAHVIEELAGPEI